MTADPCSVGPASAVPVPELMLELWLHTLSQKYLIPEQQYQSSLLTTRRIHSLDTQRSQDPVEASTLHEHRPMGALF